MDAETAKVVAGTVSPVIAWAMVEFVALLPIVQVVAWSLAGLVSLTVLIDWVLRKLKERE